MSDNENFIKINIMTLGNSAVGKTSFILKYTEDIFREVHLSTIGIDFKTKKIKLKDGQNYKVDFYDTAGQEKYKSISINTIKNADGILLMYDITNRESFDAISNWMKGIIDRKGNDFPIVLVGNKIDKENERDVTKEEGKQLGIKYRISFLEMSIKTGENVEECALELINKIVEKENLNNNQNIILGKDNNNKNNEKKCICK